MAYRTVDLAVGDMITINMDTPYGYLDITFNVIHKMSNGKYILESQGNVMMAEKCVRGEGKFTLDVSEPVNMRTLKPFKIRTVKGLYNSVGCNKLLEES